MRQIYYLTPAILEDEIYFKNFIQENETNNYYWSDDWSEEFYIDLAKEGFISTTYDTKDGLVLLPELQYSYSILDFKDLHISKKVKKLLNKSDYVFSLNTKFDELLENINNTHKYNWLKDEYLELMQKLYQNKDTKNFKIISVELSSYDRNKLIAGEIGYVIGQTYTSLSGFSIKDKKYNNYGSLQLILLAKLLEGQAFKFWNLGHPHMEYKKKLGAKVYNRKNFLQRWNKAKLLPMINLL